MLLLDSSISFLRAILGLGAHLFHITLPNFFAGVFGTDPEQVCNTVTGPTGTSCQGLFSYATGAVAFLFVIALILVFVFIYDNLRRGRRTVSTS